MENIYKALEGLENGTDLVAELKNNIKALNDENAKHRVGKNEFKAELDALKEAQASQSESMSLILGAIKNTTGSEVPDNATNINSDVATRLSKELESLKETITKTQQERDQERQAKQNLEISTNIYQNLTKGGVPEKIAKDYTQILASQMKLAEDGVIQTNDGIKADDYISKYLEDRKEILKPITSGEGSQPAQATGVASEKQGDKHTFANYLNKETNY